MRTMKHVEYMLFPRAFAVSDIAWHGKPRNYSRLLEQFASKSGISERAGSISVPRKRQARRNKKVSLTS